MISTIAILNMSHSGRGQYLTLVGYSSALPYLTELSVKWNDINKEMVSEVHDQPK